MSEENLPKTTFKSFQEFFDTPPEEMMYQEQRETIEKQSQEIADQKHEIEEAPDHKKMRDFTYHHVLNTKDSHPNIKKKFVKKFGAHNVKHFDKHVSSIVDQYDPESKKMVK